jgi:hypothetical protein
MSQGSNVSVGRGGPVYTPEQGLGFAEKGTRGAISGAEDYAQGRIARASEATAATLAQDQELARQKGIIEAASADDQAKVASDLATYQKNWADEQVRLNDAAVQVAKGARANFERSLIEQRNMAPPDPGALFAGKQGDANRGIAGIAAGLQGFLGTRGINVDAVSLINKRIDQEINSQIAAIEQKKEVTAGFRNLWAMVRDENESNEATRYKLRAAYLDQFVAKSQAEAAKYGSRLAEIGTEQQVNALTKARDAAMMDYENEVHKGLQGDVQNAIAKGNLGARYAEINANERIALGQQKAVTERAKLEAQGKAKEQAQKQAIYNPITGNFLGVAVGDDKTADQVRTSNEAYSTFHNKMLHLSERMEQVGATYQGPLSQYWSDFKDDKEAQLLRAEYEAAKADYVKLVSGAQASDKEAERLGKVIFLEGNLTGSAASQAAREFADRLGTQAEYAIQGKVVGADPDALGIPRNTIRGEELTKIPNTASRAQARGEVKGDPGVRGLLDTALNPARDRGDNTVGMLEGSRRGGAAPRGNAGTGGGLFDTARSNAPGPVGPPADQRNDAVDQLARVALDVKKPDNIRLEAIDALDQAAAAGKPGVKERANAAGAEVRRQIAGSQWDSLAPQIRERGDAAAKDVLGMFGSMISGNKKAGR